MRRTILRFNRSIVVLTVLSLVLVAPNTSAFGNARRPVTAVSVPTVTIGAVDVVPSLTRNVIVAIPLTLSSPSAHVVVVKWRVHALSANLLRDFRVSSGTSTFAAHSVEQWAHVTVAPLAPGSGSTCFFQDGDTCRTFRVDLAATNNRVTVAVNSAVDALLVPNVRPTSSSLFVGDAFVFAPPTGHFEDALVPVTLADPRSTVSDVVIQYSNVTARSPRDYRVVEHQVKIRAGATVALIPVTIEGAGAERSSYALDVDVSSTNGLVRRGVGTIVVETTVPGVLANDSVNLSQSTLTQDVGSTSDVGDTYNVTGDGSNLDIGAASTNTGGNSRVAFWPANEVSGVDSETCATWSSQNPAQGSGVVTQQGLVLNDVTQNGVTRAVTVTKNVWAYANTIFNVHVWDTADATPFTLIAHFNLASSLTVGLPWDICARTTSGELQFVVWPQGSTPPLWGSSAQGGSVSLPSAFNVAGEDGWYLGHLYAHDSASFENLTVGGPGMSFDGTTF